MRVITAQQVALYAASPFYAWPWKPILNHRYGSGYDIACHHFRRDHSSSLNLWLHLLCLILQLLGNVSLLTLLDELLWEAPVLRTTTMIGWLAAMLMAPAPLVARSGACAMVAGATLLVPLLRVSTGWPRLAAAQGVIMAGTVEWVALREPVDRGVPRYLGFAFTLILWLALWRMVANSWLYGSLRSVANLVSLGFFAAMATASSISDPVKLVATLGLLMGWILALLTDCAPLFFYSFGFAAMTAQGVAHRVSQQPSTLEQLQDLGGGVTKLSFEWAHVTYFPVLLFHSMHDSIATWRSATGVPGRSRAFKSALSS